MSDSPSVPPSLRDAIEELIAEVDNPADAVCAVIEAHAEQVGWFSAKLAGGPNVGALYDGRYDEDDVPVFRWLPSPRKDTSDA